jgi:hypothetical protein
VPYPLVSALLPLDVFQDEGPVRKPR